MTRHRTFSLLAIAVSIPIWGIRPTPVRAQLLNPRVTEPSPAPMAQTPPRIDAAVAEALRSNPITAPYRIGVELKGKTIVLRGRVGSKQVHDAAVRTVIASGAPISDELIIDTVEAARVAAQTSFAYPAARPASILTSYTYPPPLFGRYDEPFFVLEPPLVTLPAWWGEMSRARLGPQVAATQGTIQPQPAPTSLPANTVEMTIDPLGVAVLRGSVPTETDKIDIARQLAQKPGVTKIINELNVVPGPSQGQNPFNDQPPPPPTPSEAKPRPEAVEPGGIPIQPTPVPPTEMPRPARRPALPDGMPGRLDRAIQSRPELAGQAVKVTIRDGVASLSGSVAGAYEAMLAFRAVQQTPGVKDIDDSLRFVVPDGTTPNPLLVKGKPEDIEPYLEAQIRRQVGDTAHLDRVRLQGDELQVQGTLDRAEDKARVEAILRSMPVLRGIKIVPEFRALDR
jgi:osmotically-inducible protein OsmY